MAKISSDSWVGFVMLAALTFGISITVLVYITCGIEGAGQINSAVTISLMVGGALPVTTGVVNIVAQLLGSLLGASLLRLTVATCGRDLTLNVASNVINMKYSAGSAYLYEFVFTFFLCYTVWQLAVNPQSNFGSFAPVAVGSVVFLAHVFLLPINGCSINPSRSFGPAIISTMMPCQSTDLTAATRFVDVLAWSVFPIIGGVAAAVAYKASRKGDETIPLVSDTPAS